MQLDRAVFSVEQLKLLWPFKLPQEIKIVCDFSSLTVFANLTTNQVEPIKVTWIV